MLDEKYFLYLDILGFSEMVETPSRILDLFKIINSLNVHIHSQFKCIIFSDTMIVYNRFDPVTTHDHCYCVMYMIEFAQDLLYRLIGREYYFRAILTKGEFRHEALENLDAFFGRALINCVHDEKSLVGCGLFIDKELLSNNHIFSTTKHCQKYDYVFLTQDITRANVYGKEGLPFPGDLIDSSGMTFPTYAQLMFLKDVREKSLDAPDPKVRAKFQATWTFYEKMFPLLCKAWLDSNFNCNAISNANWPEAKRFFDNELQSIYSS
ncbi:MAG: hypothetical protein JEZ02_20230 [Desulfatibacillum sp.]|nr:hypothetical protein [Desulfatibacillum sp.]